MNSSATPFRYHLINQACGAANDNIWRIAYLFALGSMLSNADAASWNSLFATIFIIPFLLLAPLAGFMADRLPKVRLVRAVRLVELFIVPFAAWALYSQSTTLMAIAVVLLGVQSALFAPVKVAIVPELVSEQRLTQANGQLQVATQLAVIAGTMIAGLYDWNMGLIVGVSMTLAVVGYIAARHMPVLPAAAAAPIHLPQALYRVATTPALRAAVLVGAGFWMVAASMQLLLEPLSRDGLGLSTLGASGLLVTLVVGIAGGAYLAKRWQSLHAPLVPSLLGGVLITAVTASLASSWWQDGVSTTKIMHAAWQLALVGVGAGLWAIPAQTLLQTASDITERGAVVAVANCTHVLGIVGGATLMGWGGAVSWQFQLTIVMWLALTSSAILLVRLGWAPFAWLLEHGCRWHSGLTAHGTAHIPATGGGIIISNHPSYSDPILLAAACPRRVRFIAYAPLMTKYRLLASFCRWAGVILIDGEGSHRALRASIDAAVEAAQAGELVVIFAEGKISRSGALHRFAAGFRRIAQRANVPVIPAHIDGMYGGLTSRNAQRRLRWRRQVQVSFGPALATNASAQQGHQAVSRLAYQAAMRRQQSDDRGLAELVARQARQHPERTAIIDESGSLSYRRLLLGATCLATSIKQTFAALSPSQVSPHGQSSHPRRVAVLLPAGKAGSIANVACLQAGVTPVWINPLMGAEGVAACMRRTSCQMVLSATPLRSLLPDDVPTIMLDTWRPSKLTALSAMARIALSYFGLSAEIIAEIIGSTGSRGGIQLW